MRVALAAVSTIAALAAAAAPAPPAAAQEVPPPALVLGDGRFAVTATYRVGDQPPAPAFPTPLTRDSGTFWFFDDDNVELVVKVLEACPVNDRIWVFAAGLTNVGVELTVEDRLAGETWSHLHPPGAPFPPIQDTAAFATCGVAPACGQGTPAEIAATPRADEEAELVALFLGGGLTAPQALYQRVREDLAALRAAHPEVAGAHYAPPHDGRTLLFTFDPATADAVRAGTYAGWSCLNDWYGAVEIFAYTFDGAFVEFAGLFDTERIAPEYALLPGVQTAEPNLAARGLPFTPYLCPIGVGDTLHYFTQTGGATARTIRHFTSQPGGAPQPAGIWMPDTAEPEPAWRPLFEQCVEQFLAPCCALS